jgi:hypothetical protein
MVTVLHEIPVMFVESPNGPAGSEEAFNKLESRLSTLKGRKFYATYQYSTGQYRACVAIDNLDEAQALGFEAWSIPGGKYVRQKLLNWTEHTDEIPIVFEKLSEEYKESIDSNRPSIEFYKNQKELILMLPIV